MIDQNLLQTTQALLTYKSGQHTGAMVAFFIPPGLAQELALPGGEQPEELHITLAYLGKAADIFDKEILTDTVRKFAIGESPMKGKVQGLGRFTATDGDDAFYASFDSPNIQDFRAYLVDMLELFGGVDVSKKHAFTPHITLMYLKPDQPVTVDYIAPRDVMFDRISLVLAGERMDFPMMGHRQNVERALSLLRDKPEKKAQVIIGESGSEVPNYREATGPERCDNCVFFTHPWCELYEFQAEADDTCDGWQPNPFIAKKADYAGLIDTIQIIKGGPGSGNWGHKGRRGKVGGSSRGGGLRAIGAGSGSSLAARRGRSRWLRQKRKKIEEAKKSKNPALDDPKLKTALKDTENSELRFRKGTEKAIVFDLEGNAVFEREGDQNSVGFTSDELPFFKGMVMTHNHPDGDQGFSPGDMKMFSKSELVELRAVTAKYRYSMSRPTSMELDPARLRSSYRIHHKSLLGETVGAMNTGLMTEDQANNRHFHEVMKRVSDDTGLIYSRERWGD